MTNLFNQGGPIYMGIITIVALVIIIVAVNGVLGLTKGNQKAIGDKTYKLMNDLGILALMVGILSMCLSLFGAFGAMQMAGSISASLLAAGLKISLIPVIYGFIIFMISKLIQTGMVWASKKTELQE